MFHAVFAFFAEQLSNHVFGMKRFADHAVHAHDAVLVEQDVVKNGLTQREASLKFNVGKGTIGRIITAYNNGSLSNSTIS